MQGKPYAGNPHVRFDEGAGAPTRSGRSALLYKIAIISVVSIAMWGCYEDIAYSDDDLYSLAEKCINASIGAEQLNQELRVLFNADAGGQWTYWPSTGSCLDRACNELPSTTLSWDRVMYNGRKAVVLRFGSHANYAYLVAVAPQDSLVITSDKVRRIANNIVVVYDREMIEYNFDHPWGDCNMTK